MTAYTNAAVDNVLLRLAQLCDDSAADGGGIPMIRLGRASGVHRDLREWMPGGSRAALGLFAAAAAGEGSPAASSAAALLSASVCRSPLVVGVTALAAGDNKLLRRAPGFDVALVDEAGQMAVPAVLGPLLRARSFVLVGDHYQLPPLCVSAAAADDGRGEDDGAPPESLFRRLCEAHPQAVIPLKRQYRMSRDIQRVANELVYCGALRAGSKEVARRRLELRFDGDGAHPAAAAAFAAAPSWLKAALDPRRRVVFLSTPGAPTTATAATAGAGAKGRAAGAAGDARSGDGFANAGEAALVGAVARGLLAGGVPGPDVVAVSPYRTQVAALARASVAGAWSSVESLTVDKCQGRDRAAVLLSLVRSNARAEPGRPLADWRRVNVAATRARSKLVVVGNAATTRRVPALGALWAMAEREGWVVEVPAEALARVGGAGADAEGKAEGKAGAEGGEEEKRGEEEEKAVVTTTAADLAFAGRDWGPAAAGAEDGASAE